MSVLTNKRLYTFLCFKQVFYPDDDNLLNTETCCVKRYILLWLFIHIIINNNGSTTECLTSKLLFYVVDPITPFSPNRGNNGDDGCRDDVLNDLRFINI
jgi:hypothetical protein